MRLTTSEVLDKTPIIGNELHPVTSETVDIQTTTIESTSIEPIEQHLTTIDVKSETKPKNVLNFIGKKGDSLINYLDQLILSREGWIAYRPAVATIICMDFIFIIEYFI